MTKEQLKIMHNVPMPDEFVSEEDYIAAKTAWADAHPDEYAAILAAPHEGSQDYKKMNILRRMG